MIIRYDLTAQGMLLRDLGEFTTQLKALRKELDDYTQNNSLPFGVLFQLQALAYNAYLHPTTVLSLVKELRHISQLSFCGTKAERAGNPGGFRIKGRSLQSYCKYGMNK